jgi:hypothetical protein
VDQGGVSTADTILHEIVDTGTGVEGDLASVTSVVHLEEVETPGPSPSPDNVNHSRRSGRFAWRVDLVHTRIVSRYRRCPSTLLKKFTSSNELVITLHDVIKGMFTPVSGHSKG